MVPLDGSQGSITTNQKQFPHGIATPWIFGQSSLLLPKDRGCFLFFFTSPPRDKYTTMCHFLGKLDNVLRKKWALELSVYHQSPWYSGGIITCLSEIYLSCQVTRQEKKKIKKKPAAARTHTRKDNPKHNQSIVFNLAYKQDGSPSAACGH